MAEHSTSEHLGIEAPTQEGERAGIEAADAAGTGATTSVRVAVGGVGVGTGPGSIVWADYGITYDCGYPLLVELR